MKAMFALHIYQAQDSLSEQAGCASRWSIEKQRRRDGLQQRNDAPDALIE